MKLNKIAMLEFLNCNSSSIYCWFKIKHKRGSTFMFTQLYCHLGMNECLISCLLLRVSLQPNPKVSLRIF